MKKRLFLLLVGGFLWLGVLVGVAGAQDAPKEPAPKEPVKDAEGFEPVNGDMMVRGESIPAANLVGAAYGFILLALVGYVVSVVVRVRRVEEEIGQLRKKVESGAR